MNKSKYKKEFEDKFLALDEAEIPLTRQNIWQFISKALDEAYEDGVNKEKEIITDEYGHCTNGCVCCMTETLSQSLASELPTPTLTGKEQSK